MKKVIKVGTVLTIVWAFLCILLTGCALMVGTGGGKSIYSSWKELYHDGEKYLISPDRHDEFFLRNYDTFLWGTVENPRCLAVGCLFLRYKGFPYFSVYRKGNDTMLDVRKVQEKSFVEDGYKILLQIRYADCQKAFVTVTNPKGKSKIFEMLLKDK